MATDALVSRELRSLQDELSDSRKQRAILASASPPPSEPKPATENPDEQHLQDQLREFVSELTTLFGETEKSISAHPTQSVIGAMLVGVLIGRLLGRR